MPEFLDKATRKNNAPTPTADRKDIVGAPQMVASLANLTDGTIPAYIREEGMEALTLDTGVKYRLGADLSTWTASSGSFTAGGDLSGTSIEQTVVGVEGVPVRDGGYLSPNINFTPGSAVVSDGTNLWVGSSSLPYIVKVDPNDWSTPLNVIHLQTQAATFYISTLKKYGNYLLGFDLSDNWVVVIDLLTEKFIGILSPSGSVTACMDTLDRVWTTAVADLGGEAQVQYFTMDEIRAAFPNTPSTGVLVLIPSFSTDVSVMHFGVDGGVWCARSTTIARINPTSHTSTILTSGVWFQATELVSTAGYVWLLGLQSLGGASEYSYLYKFDVSTFPSAPVGSIEICQNVSGSSYEPYATGMVAISSTIYISDDHKHVSAVDIASSVVTVASGPSAIIEGYVTSWYSQVAVLGTKVWVAVGDDPVLLEHGFTSFTIGTTTIPSPITGFVEHQISELNLNEPAPYPNKVRAGDVLTAFPESGAPHQIVPIDTLTSLIVRKSSVVHLVISSITPDKYVSTSINLNNTGGTLDLNKLEIFNGVFDGTRYAWFIGTYQEVPPTPAVYYLWKVDTTLVSPVVNYPLEMVLPSSISQLLSIGYTNDLLVVGVMDSFEGVFRILRINPSTGVIDAVDSYPDPEFSPGVNVETHNSDFIWYGGMSASRTELNGIISRYNPSLIVHKNNDTINTVTLPIATDLDSLQLLLNDLKAKFNLHIVQSGIHLFPDTGNLISTPDATDIASPYETSTNLANALRGFLEGHLHSPNWVYSGLTITGIHYYMDILSRVTAPAVIDNTNLTAIITLANDLRTIYNTHRTQVKCPVHSIADTVNFSTVGYSPSFPQAALLLNNLRDKFNTHRVQFGIHLINDSTNVVTGDATLDSPYAGPSYPNSYALVIDLKAKFNAHLGETEVHINDDVDSLVTMTDPSSDTDLAGIIALANELGGSNYLAQAPYSGAFNYHLLQGSNYVDTVLPPLLGYGNATLAAVKQYQIGDDTWLMVVENNPTGVPYFYILEGQFKQSPSYAPGSQLYTWNFLTLTGAPNYALDLAINLDSSNFWLMTGNTNEAISPYKVHLIQGLGGVPNPLISLSQNLPSDGPSCITNNNHGLPQIAFRQGDYVGTLNDYGNINPQAIYPMGGSLKLGPLLNLAGVPVAPITDLGSNQGKALVLIGGRFQLDSAVATPLSNVRYVDGGTTVPSNKQDGNIGSPYSSNAVAVIAVGEISNPGPTLLITPGYYEGDSLYWLSPGNPPVSLNIQGLGSDPYAVTLPLVEILSGNSAIEKVYLSAGMRITSTVTLSTVIVDGSLWGGVVKATNSSFWGTIYGTGLYFTSCTFQSGITLFTGYIGGSNSNELVDTTTNNTLRVRKAVGDSFTVITVTSGVNTPKSTIVSDLNSYLSALGLEAQVNDTFQVRIWSSTGYVEVDTAGNGSTLNNVIEWEDLSANGGTVQMDSLSYWSFKSGSCIYGGTITLAIPPSSLKYLPLIAGVQSAGSTYNLLGVLPTINYYNLGVGTPTFNFDAIINIPTDSTAQVRLYDKTNSTILFESSVISGLQTEYLVEDAFTPAIGTTVLEFWLSTPTNTGGNASCISSGITITFT